MCSEKGTGKDGIGLIRGRAILLVSFATLSVSPCLRPDHGLRHGYVRGPNSAHSYNCPQWYVESRGQSSFALKATSGQQIVQGSLVSVGSDISVLVGKIMGKNFATSWQILANLLQECSTGSAYADLDAALSIVPNLLAKLEQLPMAPKAMWKKLVQLQVCCAQDMAPTLPAPNSVTVTVLLQRPMNLICSDLHTACATCVRPLQCLSFTIIDSTCDPPSGHPAGCCLFSGLVVWCAPYLQAGSSKMAAPHASLHACTDYVSMCSCSSCVPDLAATTRQRIVDTS